MGDICIELRNVTRTYRVGEVDVHALRSVNLTIVHGEFVAVMGSSGSGKSTLMAILGCLDQPSGGEYFFEGRNIAQLSEPELAHIRSTSRRRVEQAQALADYQLAQWQAAQLSLSGNTVLQAIALAAAREQIAAVGDIIAVDRRNLELVRLASEAGKSARLDVLTAESQLDSDRALLPPLQQQASVAAHALAVLAGKTAPWEPPPFTLQDFSLPAELPLVLPSLLVRRRPDILAAQAQLHAASAAIGIASAQLYPDITLSAQWTATGASVGGLFGGASLWNLAANLVAPVFDAGTRAAQRAAATDAYAAQLGAYRQALLQAFGQVADTLESLRHDAALLEAQHKALGTALAVLDLTRQSYQAGQASLLQLLESQRQYQHARLGHARAQGQRYADTAQWFIAMGGAPTP